MDKNNSQKKPIGFTITILISGIVIAGGIFISRTNLISDFLNNQNNEKVLEDSPKIQPISEKDHIIGNPDADIVVIEYSDFECPYCKEFHTTMQRLIDEFGESSRIAWVYRHLPLDEVHLNAKRVALTSECVGKLAGENNFWKFTNKIFDNAPQSLLKNNTDIIVQQFGLSPDVVDECIQDPEIIKKVEDDTQDGDYFKQIDREFGTPYNIIITKTGQTTNVSGAIPYQILKDFIEQHSLDF